MFNQQELLAIIKICDAGVRAGGLEIAELAVPISRKIRAILQQQQQQPQMQGNGMQPSAEGMSAPSS
jgi:hypothetical protein